MKAKVAVIGKRIPQLELVVVREKWIRLPHERITDRDQSVANAQTLLADKVVEHLIAFLLDGRNNVIGVTTISKGGLHSASVRVVDVLRAALVGGASAFILAHNHPSNDPSPSREDIMLTKFVADAALQVGCPLLDHIIVTRSGGWHSIPVPTEELR